MSDSRSAWSHYRLTIFPSDDHRAAVPAGFNGTLLGRDNCPVPFTEVTEAMWKWIDSKTTDVNVSADVLVTPHEEESGVPQELIIDSRVISTSAKEVTS